jgi:hypothetical protein
MRAFIFTIALSIAANHIGFLHGEIISVDSDFTYIEACDGGGWVLDTTSGYNAGEHVFIAYNSMGTEDVSDDEIIFMEKMER